MELKEITFSGSDDGLVMPETITVKMSAQEALWIALVSGKQRGISPHSGIYQCLTGDVFNRYWEDGVNEARSAMFFEIPPINYES